MFKAIVSLIALLVLGLGASGASAAIITDNFDSYTPGNAETNTNSTYWSYANNIGAAPQVVNEGGTHGNVLTVDTTGQNNYAPSFDWYPDTVANSNYGTGYGNTGGPPDSGTGSAMAFDVRINNVLGATYFVGSSDGNSGQPYVGIDGVLGSDNMYAPVTGNPTLIPHMTVGQWYTIWIAEAPPEDNSTGDIVDFYVDKTLVASGPDSGILNFVNPILGLAGYPTEADSLSFDNLAFSNTPTDIIPEPASLGLLGMGGLLLLKRGRRAA